MTWPALTTHSAQTMRDAGFSASKIARYLGTTKNAVLGKFYRLGLSEKGKNSHWSNERRAKFIVLWMSLAPVRQIAQEMSMSPHAVHNRRAIRGLPSRKELLVNRTP